ncbi:MAG: peptidoglycan-associated lipoprotein Pal [Alphaproteobacteria bacterium]|nr:peptidoglycan-associated lipoprotein Pal [Alphaproteobacteria bacterium]
MRLKLINLLSVLSVFVLVSACATDPEDTGGAKGEGAQTAGTGASTAAPVAVEPGTAQDFIVNVGDRVFFAFNKSNLDAKAQETLNKQAAWLKKYPSVTILVAGHCDERGTREYNLALGDRRASAVRDYLISQGVDGSRVETISFGKDAPTCGESTEGCWAQNRNGTTALTGGAVGS